jgi:hypothetical protein
VERALAHELRHGNANGIGPTEDDVSLLLKSGEGYRELGAYYLEQSHKEQLQRYFEAIATPRYEPVWNQSPQLPEAEFSKKLSILHSAETKTATVHTSLSH